MSPQHCYGRQWLQLSLALVIGCGSNSEPNVAATGARGEDAGLARMAAAGCSITSSYAVEPQFRVTEAIRRDAGRAPDDGLAVTVANELSDTVAIQTLVMVRRSNGSCGPPTGELVTPATAMSPNSTGVITGTANASPVDLQTSTITVTVTATTTTERQIRTPDFVLALE